MSQIQTVKEASNIVDVVSEHVVLQRSGSSLKGLCPFHSEKTPSFFVSEELQRYKCFGCQETGDVFTFLEKIEGLTFYESLQKLAEAAGIELEPTARTKQDEDREAVLTILEQARAYYHYVLTSHEKGALGREYLTNRGMSSQVIKQFSLGCVPAGWSNIYDYLVKKKKHPPRLVEKAGLIMKGKRGGYYDRFRSRLMFPLRDHRGRVVG
ncbi:DNA primase, partial [Candidatus Woesebacteria bacterium]|nr:DNA primase [Candidatus Woesebacteria bacterium]